MTNYSQGHQAEEEAAKYLNEAGFSIHQLNWKTPVCEIDIVAEKSKIIYFVEVKYRTSSSQGTGVDYITPKKLNQMKFAAECWVNEYKWQGDYELAAIEVSGENFKITNFLESIF
jgi:Holliday junction resolvase-like predicted endonuclease